MLYELETDKVSLEVPAPAAGVLGDIKAAQGQSVEVNAVLATISSSGSGANASAHANGAAPQAEAKRPRPGIGKDIEHAPSAKKAMAEANLDPKPSTRQWKRRTHHERRYGPSRCRSRRGRTSGS